MATLIKGRSNQRRRICYVECPPDGHDVFATTTVERLVTVWSLKRRKKLAEIDTALDPDSGRLAILETPVPMLFVGTWARHGLRAYNVADGTCLWQRKDLKRIQTVCAFPPELKPARVGVHCEGGGFFLLDHESGGDVVRMKATKEIFVGPKAETALYCDRYALRFGRVGRRPSWRKNFGDSFIVCAALGADRMVVHISGTEHRAYVPKALRLPGVDYDPDSQEPEHACSFDAKGKLLWTLNERIDGLTWSIERDEWVMVVHTNEKLRSELITVNRDGGVTSRRDLGWTGRTDFLDNGRFLVTDFAQVLRVPSLKVVWQFDEFRLRGSKKKSVP